MDLPMTNSTTDKYSASEQGLGYMYQPRLALLRVLELPENTTVFLEKDDDLDFVDKDGSKSLASLKHKATGDRLTDLSTDFWKSVRIWLVRYKRDGRSASNLSFFLFTTGTVSDSSFLKEFLPVQSSTGNETKTLVEQAEEALSRSKSDFIGDIAQEFNKLTPTEKQDFLVRILIFDGSPRIEDIPETKQEIKRPPAPKRPAVMTVSIWTERSFPMSVVWVSRRSIQSSGMRSVRATVLSANSLPVAL